MMSPEVKKRKSNPGPVEINLSDLTKVEKLGQGGFGTVFHMIWKRKNARDLDVAAKRLFEVDRHELEILSKLDHHNIVKLIGVVPEDIHFMLILELCRGGSLRDYLTQHKSDPLPSHLCRSWAEQAVRAIEYLQDMKVIHKDVKSDNYLIANGNVLKLADFGLAKLAEKTRSQATGRGTAAYMAPEIFLEGWLSPSYDIFAYGVVLWELVTREFPFEGLEFQVICMLVCAKKLRLRVPDDCPEDLSNLMRWCWLENHRKRPSTKNILTVLTQHSHSLASITEPELCQYSARRDTTNLGFWLQKPIGTGKVGAAQGLAISPDGDIAVADFGGARLKVYDKEGKIKHIEKFSHQHQITSPYSVVISSAGKYFVTDQTKVVKALDATFKNKHTFSVVIPDVETSDAASTTDVILAGLALDKRQNLLIGCLVHNIGYISTYTQDGIYRGSIKINIRPQYLAVTPQETIIVSSNAPEAVHVVDKTGSRKCTLDPPVSSTYWMPRGVCCSQDTIFVANATSGLEGKIYCFAASGGYIFLGCIISEVSYPMGIALTENGKTLMIAERDVGIKIFRKLDLETAESEIPRTLGGRDLENLSEDLNTPKSQDFQTSMFKREEPSNSKDYETTDSKDFHFKTSESDDFDWFKYL